jgi:N-hydroxyarylamine O-acetyltransferase
VEQRVVDRYLERLGADRTTSLADLHERHLRTVPFENLSVHLGEPIVLEEDVLVDKVVDRHRGGFCYELNGAFAALLRALGFRVDYLSAQVHGTGGFGPPFDHMALLVRAADRVDQYLVDVGCGTGSPAHPLLLRDGHEEHQPETASTYRLARTADGWQLDIRRDGEEWQPHSAFDETPRTQADFLPRCRFQDGSPDSHFTRGPLCSRNIPGGRITLTGRQLIVTGRGVREERDLPDDPAFHAALREYFGIDLAIA